MPADQNASRAAMERLAPLLGEWSLEASFDPAPGRVLFEWALDGQFLLERSEIPHPAAPDGLMLIGYDHSSGAYTQHYFDSRGVARVYAMTFGDGLWTLSRESADFMPLEFSQRYAGRFSDDGDRIEGRWDISHDGSTWERDFDLTYTRAHPG